MKFSEYFNQNGQHLIYLTECGSWDMLLGNFNQGTSHIVEVPFKEFLSNHGFMKALKADVNTADIDDRAWKTLTYLYNRHCKVSIAKGLIKDFPTYLANTKNDRRSAMVVKLGDKYALVESIGETGKVVTYDDFDTLCAIATFGYFTSPLDKGSDAMAKLDETLQQFESGELKLRDHMPEPTNKTTVESFTTELKTHLNANAQKVLDDFTLWVNSTELAGTEMHKDLWTELCFHYQDQNN